MDQMKEFIKMVAAVFERDPAALKEEMRLQDDLGAGSVHYFMLAAEIGEMFGVKLTYSKIKKCVTVGDLLTLVKSLQK